MKEYNKDSLEKIRDNLSYCPETGVFTWSKPRQRIRKGTEAGSLTFLGYKRIVFCGESYYSHRLAWLFMTGDFPKEQIDHINHKKGDNRFCNLRECSRSQNLAYKGVSKNNTSGYKGVVWHKSGGKWQSQIRVKGEYIYLGVFNNKVDAAKAYNMAAKKHFGEFAVQNKIRN